MPEQQVSGQLETQKEAPKPKGESEAEYKAKLSEGQKSKKLGEKLFGWLSGKKKESAEPSEPTATTHETLKELADGKINPDSENIHKKDAESPVQKEAEEKKVEFWNVLAQPGEDGKPVAPKDLAEKFPELCKVFTPQKDVDKYAKYVQEEIPDPAQREDKLKKLSALSGAKKISDLIDSLGMDFQDIGFTGKRFDSDIFQIYLKDKPEDPDFAQSQTPSSTKRQIDALLAYGILENPDVRKAKFSDVVAGADDYARMSFTVNPKIKATPFHTKWNPPTK